MQIDKLNSQERAFSNLVDHVNNIEAELTKAAYATMPSLMISIASEIWKESNAAKASLSQLPLSFENNSIMQKFLAQVGDYIYTLEKKVVINGKLEKKDTDTLDKLAAYTEKLAAALSALQGDYQNDMMNFERGNPTNIFNLKSNKQYSKGLPILSESVVKISESITEYPTLIYDGPYSDHIEKMQPLYLQDKGNISLDEAVKIASKVFKCEPSQLKLVSQDNGKIAGFRFAYNTGETLITKKGGVPAWLITDSYPQSQKLKPEYCISKAKEYLNMLGFDGMSPTYWIVNSNILSINFAFKKDNIIFYPDLIKVSISLDNAAVTGLEAQGFIMSHKVPREAGIPKITRSEAQSKIYKNLSVLSSNVCVIPSMGLKDTLCYEFKCKSSDGKKYLIYINAKTGIEENILILLETLEGTLTI